MDTLVQVLDNERSYLVFRESLTQSVTMSYIQYGYSELERYRYQYNILPKFKEINNGSSNLLYNSKAQLVWTGMLEHNKDHIKNII